MHERYVHEVDELRVLVVLVEVGATVRIDVGLNAALSRPTLGDSAAPAFGRVVHVGEELEDGPQVNEVNDWP